MSLEVEHAVWLCMAGVLLIAAIVVVARAWRGHSWRWRLAGVLLPMGAAMFAAAAMAGVSLAGEKHVLILLDFSPSTRGAAWRDPAWVRALAEKRLGSDRRVTVVAFGLDDRGGKSLLRNVAPGDAAKWPAEWATTPKPEGRTDISRALAERLPGESLEEDQFFAARWVITDGLFSPPPQRSRAKVPMPIAWTVVPPAGIDVGIAELALQSRVMAGAAQEEVLARVRVVGRGMPGAPLPGEITVQVEFRRDGILLQKVPVQFHAGEALNAERWVTIGDTVAAQPAAPRRYDVTASLMLPGGAGDAWPENDHGSIIDAPPGELRTLVVGEREPAFPHTAFVKTADFNATADRLAAEGWQTIVLDDVPGVPLADGTHTLSAETSESLYYLVRQNGTGLVILGNGHAFGPGRYGEQSASRDFSPAKNRPAEWILDQLAPVWSHPEEGRTTHGVFLLDASASMNEAVSAGGSAPQRKIVLAGAALDNALAPLGPEDRVTLITFNSAARVVTDGARLAVEKDLPKALATVEPAGATAPDAALEPVAAAFGTGQDGMNNLLVLLTDGEIPAMDVAQWRDVVVKAHARLLIVAPPTDADKPSVLRLLAAIPGASWVQTADPAEWRAALAEAVALQVRGTTRGTPIHWATTSGEPLAGDAAAWTRVWKKPEAILLAEGMEKGEKYPMAAVAQRGLGKVGALATSDDGSPAYSALVDRMIRDMAAVSGDRRFTVSAKQAADGGWIIAADGISEAGFIDGESIQAWTQSWPNDHVQMPQTGPGHYEVRLAAHGPISATLVRGRRDFQLVGRVQRPDVAADEWPASVERTFNPVAENAMSLPAAMDDSTRWDVPATAHITLAMPFWIAAAVAGLAALFLRR